MVFQPRVLGWTDACWARVPTRSPLNIGRVTDFERNLVVRDVEDEDSSDTYNHPPGRGQGMAREMRLEQTMAGRQRPQGANAMQQYLVYFVQMNLILSNTSNVLA